MRLSRQNKILEIIRTNEVETQDQLLQLLRDAGYSVTQATVSRDIRELQLIKGQARDGKYRYIAGNYDNRPISDRFIKIFRETVLSYDSAQNLIVVKTLSGCSGAAGEAIDCLSLDHIVGSICGDNTMLVVVDHEDNVPLITAEFDRIMNSGDAAFGDQQ
ncbi:MAG: arginine repressor [Mogibacterium sp.]|nr:arginine repressor [Mogibacterium sp.]